MCMTKTERIHQKIHFWLDDLPYSLWWLNEAGNWLTCKILGHIAIPDQCMNADHDFCAYCLKSMPGKAVRRDQ